MTLGRFRGRVVLVTNTASRCGYTPQYAGLQALYATYRERGFEVLAFPCNQFGRQEPGSERDIRSFCTQRYGVTFPLFAKIDVNGPNASSLYRWLKSEAPGILGTGSIKWNFTKFLLGRDGRVVRRYAPRTPPERLAPDIERLLAQS